MATSYVVTVDGLYYKRKISPKDGDQFTKYLQSANVQTFTRRKPAQAIAARLGGTILAVSEDATRSHTSRRLKPTS